MINIEDELEKIDFSNQEWWLENFKKIMSDQSVSASIREFAILGQDPVVDLAPKSFLLGRHYSFSRNHAEVMKSRCNSEILALDGMSSPKVRHLLNNICSLEGSADYGDSFKPSYLEIGCGTGSTLVSAMYKNSGCNFFAIDKFCSGKHDQSSRERLFDRLRLHGLEESVTFFEQDFNEPPQELKDKSINIYFFDGPHSVKDHMLALTKYERFFDDSVLVIIDDWKDPMVQLGTHLGLSKINYQLKYWDYLPAKGVIAPIFQETVAAARLETSFGDKIPAGDTYRWWNGIMVLLLEKNQ